MIDSIISELGLSGSEAQDRKTQLEMAEIHSKTQIELAKVEQKTQLDLAKIELECVKVKSADNLSQRQHDNKFNISSCLKLMPKFCSEEVDVFFDAFEKIAKELQWPEETWPILVQSSFTGKAQEAYASLDAVKSTDYEQVKQVVLLAYEVVPEGHRQRFRSLRRKPGETYLDLIRHQEAAFERWLKGVGAYTYSELRQHARSTLPFTYLREMGLTCKK